jgi:hypothetical protein
MFVCLEAGMYVRHIWILLEMIWEVIILEKLKRNNGGKNIMFDWENRRIWKQWNAGRTENNKLIGLKHLNYVKCFFVFVLLFGCCEVHSYNIIEIRHLSVDSAFITGLTPTELDSILNLPLAVWRVPHEEQIMPTLPEHLMILPFFVGVHIVSALFFVAFVFNFVYLFCPCYFM